MAFTDYTDEQSRALINLRQRYEVWRDAERVLRAMPYDLRRKAVGKYEYLYEIHDRSGNGTSLGPWDEDAEARLTTYKADKAEAKERLARARAKLDEGARLVRALRVPMLTAAPGSILREADCRGLLDGDLLVIGTNCLVAYQQEAVLQFDISDETEDFDLAWASKQPAEGTPLWDTLKAVDATFTVNTEREFQARNSATYEVELLVAPSRASTLGPREKPRPIPIPEQEWLLLGRPVDQVVACRDGSAARLIVPDPRWFALQKLWLGHQPKRDPFKRHKDLTQGNAVLNAVAQAMPQYRLDAVFVDSIPAELLPYWQEWRDTRSDTKG